MPRGKTKRSKAYLRSKALQEIRNMQREFSDSLAKRPSPPSLEDMKAAAIECALSSPHAFYVPGSMEVKEAAMGFVATFTARVPPPGAKKILIPTEAL